MRHNPWFPPLLICLPFVLLALVGAARAGIVPVRADSEQALVVTSTADDGPGSLRQAIVDAADGDVITFAITGDITLLRTLVIGKRLTIDGPGAEELAIRGGERVRLFKVARGAELTLRGLTLADGVASDEPWNTPTVTATFEPQTPGPPRQPPPSPFPTPTRRALIAAHGLVAGEVPGPAARGQGDQPQPTRTLRPTPTRTPYPHRASPYAGGAINNQGMLTVEDCVFEGNQAPNIVAFGGAIYNDQAVAEIRRSQFLRNRSASGFGADPRSLNSGGAIFNEAGTMTIVDSAFVGNTAESSGSAVYSLNGRTVIVGSIFLRNTEDLRQAAIVTSAIESNNPLGGELILANSTVAHHDAGGRGSSAGLVNLGRTVIVNSTFLNSMIFDTVPEPSVPSVKVTLINSLLVNENGGQVCNGGAIVDMGHNLQFPGRSCGESIASTDPLLDDWALGGGPTLTISLAPGSPAIDAGDPEACADWPVLGLDARGLVRGGDGNGDGIGGCDIGAFEAGASITATPTRTPTRTPTVGPSPTPSATYTPGRTRPPGEVFLPVAWDG